MASETQGKLPRKTALKRLRAFRSMRLSDDLTIPEVWAFADSDAPQDHSGRTIAIVAASLLEDALQAAITIRMVTLTKDEEERLFSDNGTLSTFAARIEMAYALGVIGPHARHDLTTIRYIRNAFAHVREHLTFESPEIAALCEDLWLPKNLGTYGELAQLMIASIETPKEQFVESAKARWLMLEFPGVEGMVGLLAKRPVISGKWRPYLD